MIHISVVDPGIYAHNSKDPKADGVHDQHDPVVIFFKMSLQKPSLHTEDKKYKTGGYGRHNGIGRVLKHIGRNDSQNNIPDHSASH